MEQFTKLQGLNVHANEFSPSSTNATASPRTEYMLEDLNCQTDYERNYINNLFSNYNYETNPTNEIINYNNEIFEIKNELEYVDTPFFSIKEIYEYEYKIEKRINELLKKNLIINKKRKYDELVGLNQEKQDRNSKRIKCN